MLHCHSLASCRPLPCSPAPAVPFSRTPAARATPTTQPPLRVFSRASARPPIATPKSVSFAPLPSITTTKPATQHRLAASSTPRRAQKQEPPVETIHQAAAEEEEPQQGHYEDASYDPMEYDYGPMDDGMVDDDEHAPADATTAPDEPAAAAHTTPAARSAGDKAAAAAWRTPAGAVAEASTPATAVPASGWQKMYDGEEEETEDAEGMEGGEEEGPAAEPWVDDGSLPLDADARLPLYLLDAHEEASQPGTVFLFGKVPAGGQGQTGQYLSCCAVVKGMPRTLFFVPREPVGSSEISALHDAAQKGDAEAKKQLIPAVHAAFSAVKSEVRALLTGQGVTQMTMKPVMRQYAFENPAVCHGQQWVLKVRYPATQPSLPLNTSGDTFSTVFGSNQSPLEALMLKRKVMGPSWVAVKQPRRVDPGQQLSYCQLEVEVEGHKAVFAAAEGSRPAPPLTVAAVHLKTVINPATAANEVVSASVVYLPRVNTDGPTQFSRRDIRHFSAVRKLDGVGFPSGFDAEVKRANQGEVGRRNGGAVLAMQPNERALLTMLIMRLKDVDADVFVGHNFAAFDLDVLLHRMQALKVPHWASLGRLKRSKFPNLGGGGHTFGGGAGQGALSVVAGRLLCDTYLAARDLVKETEYTLTTLSKNLLGETRTELASADLPGEC